MESEIVGVVSLSTTEIYGITRLKFRCLGLGYLNITWLQTSNYMQLKGWNLPLKRCTVLLFLAHLSTTSSGGFIVTGHRPASVRPSICPSVNNFVKNLLLQNQKANLDKTWQECSLGEALQKLLKEFNSNKNSGCHGNKMAENGKNL